MVNRGNWIGWISDSDEMRSGLLGLSGEVVGMVVETAPLEAVYLWDVAAESLEGNRVSGFPTVDARILLEEVGRQRQVGFQQLQVVHHTSTLPPLLLSPQTGNPLLHGGLDGEGDGLSLLISGGFLPSCSHRALIDKLVEVLVEFSLVLETEGDVLASLRDLVYGQDLPPPQQLLDPLRLRM